METSLLTKDKTLILTGYNTEIQPAPFFRGFSLNISKQRRPFQHLKHEVSPLKGKKVVAINTLQSERLQEAGPPGFFTLCTRLQADDPQVRTCVSAEPSNSSEPAVASLLSVSAGADGFSVQHRDSHMSVVVLRQSQTTHISSVYCFFCSGHASLPPSLPCLPPVKLTASRKARGSDKRRGPAHLHVLAGFIAYNVTLWSFHS